MCVRQKREKHGLFCVIELFFILKKCDGQYRKQWVAEETEQLIKA